MNKENKLNELLNIPYIPTYIKVLKKLNKIGDTILNKLSLIDNGNLRASDEQTVGQLYVSLICIFLGFITLPIFVVMRISSFIHIKVFYFLFKLLPPKFYSADQDGNSFCGFLYMFWHFCFIFFLLGGTAYYLKSPNPWIVVSTITSLILWMGSLDAERTLLNLLNKESLLAANTSKTPASASPSVSVDPCPSKLRSFVQFIFQKISNKFFEVLEKVECHFNQKINLEEESDLNE